MLLKMHSKWKKLSSKYVYKNPWIKVREDKVIQPDGKEGIYAYVEQGDGVCIIPVDSDKKIWMVNNYRYVYDESNWELVAGEVERGESHREAARRELIEELELDADEYESIGFFRPSNGRFKHETEFFVAKALKKSKPDLPDWDVRDRKAFTLEEIDEMIERRDIVDGYVMSGLYFYKLYLNKS